MPITGGDLDARSWRRAEERRRVGPLAEHVGELLVRDMRRPARGLSRLEGGELRLGRDFAATSVEDALDQIEQLRHRCAIALVGVGAIDDDDVAVRERRDHLVADAEGGDEAMFFKARLARDPPHEAVAEDVAVDRIERGRATNPVRERIC